MGEWSKYIQSIQREITRFSWNLSAETFFLNFKFTIELLQIFAIKYNSINWNTFLRLFIAADEITHEIDLTSAHYEFKHIIRLLIFLEFDSNN